MAIVRALASTLLAALSLHCAAAPFAVRLGTERVALDTPPGFADTLDLGSPRLQELAEALTSASNRILLFALTDGDLRRFTLGDTPELRRYLLVAAPRAMERDRMGAAQFAAYVGDALRALGKAAEPADIRKHLDALPQGQASVLWELRRTPQAVSVMQGTRVPIRPDAKPLYLLTSTSLLLVHGKPLSVSVFAGYNDESDPEWLRVTTARWVDELLRLNAR
jgi:hypothetical protein